LEVLELGDTGISDRGLAKLAPLKNLRTLDLKATRVTSKGMAALVGHPALRHLKLWQAAGIDDASVPYFLQMKNLEILEVPETKITAAGLEQLSQKKELKQLFIGALDVTPEQLDAFRAALPGCRVSWWKKPKIEFTERPARRGGN